MSHSIVTKTGDAGTTKLLYGQRVSKADLRIEACGAIDELNSFLGLARTWCDNAEIKAILEALQRENFVVGAEIATPQEQHHKLKTRVTPEMTAQLEDHIAAIEARPGVLDDWALPGATVGSAALDVARTVARRAERCVVRLAEAGAAPDGAAPGAEVLRYLNRLSDLLWLLGRRHEMDKGADGALRPA